MRILYVLQKGGARSRIVRGVHHILKAASSLLSVGELEDRGACIIVDSPGKRGTVTRNQEEVLLGRRHKKLWRLS